MWGIFILFSYAPYDCPSIPYNISRLWCILGGSTGMMGEAMPELRRDPITGQWVAIATERAARPESFLTTCAPEEEGAWCPFCPDFTAQEEELLAYRPPGARPGDDSWTLRVLPNKYPAFTMSGGRYTDRRGLYESTAGLGAHEIIVYTREHDRDLALATRQEATDLVRACRTRMREHARHPRVEYVSIICNHGAEAGATLRHPHCQLLAIPVLPNTIVAELREAGYYYDTRAQCIFCAMLKQEEEELGRVVWQNEAFVAFTPWASRVPFEVWILPRRHEANFENILHDEIPQMGEILREVLARLYFGLNNPPFNFYVHTAPCQREGPRFYHWHVEILPRLTHQAGFELSTGLMINTVSPEDAAEFLRSVSPDIAEMPVAQTPTPVLVTS